MNQTDWNFELLEQLASEEISDGGEVRGFVRRGNNPMSFHIVERCVRSVLFYSEQPDLGILCLRDCFGAVDCVDERPLHVGLSRTQPDFADQNVLDGE